MATSPQYLRAARIEKLDVDDILKEWATFKVSDCEDIRCEDTIAYAERLAKLLEEATRYAISPSTLKMIRAQLNGGRRYPFARDILRSLSTLPPDPKEPR